MLAVVTVSVVVVLQPASSEATEATSSTRTASAAMRLRGAGRDTEWALAFMDVSSSRGSIKNEPDVAPIGLLRRLRVRSSRHAVDAVEAAEQAGGDIRGVGIAVIRLGQVLLR